MKIYIYIYICTEVFVNLITAGRNNTMNHSTFGLKLASVVRERVKF